MIEIKKPDLPPRRYVDPEESVAGKCMTCGSVVHCLLKDARLPVSKFAEKKDHIGAWTDLVSAECPRCGARVFIMPAGEFQKLMKERGIV